MLYLRHRRRPPHRRNPKPSSAKKDTLEKKQEQPGKQQAEIQVSKQDKNKTKTKEVKKQEMTQTKSSVDKKAPKTQSHEALLVEAVKLHDAGVNGDKEAVVQAHEILEKLREANPQDPIVEGYYGSTIALLGRDAVDPNERFVKALEGLKILDRVVSNNPDHIQVRSLRGFVSYRLPEMYFHRTTTAIEDFNYLINRYEQDNTVFSEQFYWQLLYNLGHAYKNVNNTEKAEETWYKLLNTAADTRYQELLKAEGIQIEQQSTQTTSDNPSPGDSTKRSADGQQKYRQLLEQGAELHARALKGDPEATRQALTFFQKAREKYPGDQLIAAYCADCLSMTGRDATSPQDMFANAIKAMKALDKCVNNDPGNIQIRFIRAYQSFRLPEAFFHRTATAIEDFNYFIQQYEEDNSVFSEETYWQVLYDLGTAYKRLEMKEEAATTWQKLLSLNPDPKYRSLVDKQQTRNPDDSSPKLASLNTREKLLAEGKRLHDQGVAGNAVAAQRAFEIFEKARDMYPHDPVIMGYYGSSLALTGKYAKNPSVMFSNAIKGLATLKKAIGLDWNNAELRLLRGYLIYSLPAIFFHDLLEKAIKDFRFVKSAYEKGDASISEATYWQVLYDLGVCYQRVGDEVKAEKVWSRLLKKTTDSKYEALINKTDVSKGEKKQ
ncbi:MAG: tetratricopeptide repeat protein [Thermoanaerobacteraceae bacterium]|nr:tetratricopeptide repeat protein [Thermoanaerobacteraceae bacterium]